MTPTEPRRFVGVDVVDLRDRRCVGKERDARFLSRVLNDVERRALASTPDPDAALWRLWSAKEAAFKVVSKVRGAPPAFVHTAFRVDLPGPLTKSDLGGVEWEEISVFIQWHEMPGPGRGARLERRCRGCATGMGLGCCSGPRSGTDRSDGRAAAEAE